MPANVETMMYVGAEPWHGLGTRFEQEVPAREAMVAAGLDWTVSREDVFVEVPGGPTFEGQRIPGYKAITRSKDRQVLSVMSDDYQPFQNQEMFDFAEALVGTHRARFHTAGSLNEGRRVWALMKTDRLLRVNPRDQVEAYLLLGNSFDGSLAFLAAFTGVRVVCMNTLNAALRQLQQAVRLRHTGKLQDKVQEAKKVLGLADHYFNKLEEVSQHLAKTPYTEGQMKALTEYLFAPPKLEVREDGTVKPVSDTLLLNRQKVQELFTTGKGHQEHGLEGTAWAAYNAVTEFTDHWAKPRVKDPQKALQTRLNSVFFGNASTLKQKAFKRIATDVGMEAMAA